MTDSQQQSRDRRPHLILGAFFLLLFLNGLINFVDALGSGSRAKLVSSILIMVGSGGCAVTYGWLALRKSA
jgi:hypothetical protein